MIQNLKSGNYYVVPDENYQETQGLDFSLLKIEPAENQNFASLFPYLVDFGVDEQLLLIVILAGKRFVSGIGKI